MRLVHYRPIQITLSIMAALSFLLAAVGLVEAQETTPDSSETAPVVAPEALSQAAPEGSSTVASPIPQDQPAVGVPQSGDAGPAVIGGTDARVKNHPYYVMLVDDEDFFFCGGTLIRDRWVLTAAHCVNDAGNDAVTVRLGVKSTTDYVDAVQSDKIVVHPGYGIDPEDPDLALIHLERKPDFSSPFIAKTSVLRRPDLPRPGTTHKVIGYGQSSVSGDAPTKLQVANVKIKACDGAYGVDDQKTNICAGGKINACYGDSGGPLVVHGKVAGVVSYGTESCVDQYGVYIRVSTYLPWIRETISELTTCRGRAVTVELAKGELPTEGDDVIGGTSGDDVIYGLEGDDIICGRLGDDTVVGGPGRDVLVGGGGTDTCRGSSGVDRARPSCEVIKSARTPGRIS